MTAPSPRKKWKRLRCLKRLDKALPYCTRSYRHTGWCEAPYLWGRTPAIFRWHR